ncbi:Cytochrome P450 [Sesbania bispinosa]|nr:Cytochrome P450 [Sesbania bispinosa]
MGLQAIYLLVLLSISLFIIVTLMIRRNPKKTDSIPNIPPGPRKLPIVGNIPHVVGSPPHRKLRELAKNYGPLMHLQLGEVFFIVVSSAEYAREVMKNHDVIFASRPRTLTSEIMFYDSTDIAFSPYERIASEEGSIINLSQAVISLMYSITSRAAFGKKYMEQEEFISVVREFLRLAGGFYIGDLFPSAKFLQNLSGRRPKLEKLHQKVDRILENIINDHKEAKSRTKEGLIEGDEDLIDVLLKFEDSGMTKKSDSAPKLPPGPWKLPIIGNIHNLVGSLPHRQLRDLSAKYGPLMHLKLGEVSTIVVSSPEYAREVLKTHDLIFASRPPILASKILTYDSLGMSFAPYGDYWRQLRKICTLELLSSKRVQSFQPIRGEELTNLIKWIASKEGSSINLTKEVISTISTITSRSAFGKKCKDHKKFISVVKEATEVAGGFDLGDLYPSAKWLQHISGLKPKLEKLHQQADQIMQNIINQHREAKSKTTEDQGEEVGEDLVDVLLRQEFGLSDNSVKAVIMVSKHSHTFHQYYLHSSKVVNNSHLPYGKPVT